MKRSNRLAGAVLAVTGLASAGAFAAPQWGPSGEASYEEHQAQQVSQYSRAEVQAAYLQAAATGALPRTFEVVTESPAELAAVIVAQAPRIQEPVAAAAQISTPSYASPSDSEVLSSSLSSRPGDAQVMLQPASELARLPVPSQPDAPLQFSPDMMSNNEDLALSEGEEVVTGGE
jgi:hypothetical protein